MLSVLLFVLKIIGIILLVILGILGVLLLLLVLLLITPVRYGADVGIQEKKANGIVKVHYLLHLVEGRLNITDNHISYDIRVAFLHFPRKKKDGGKDRSKDEKKLPELEANQDETEWNEQELKAQEPELYSETKRTEEKQPEKTPEEQPERTPEETEREETGHAEQEEKQKQESESKREPEGATVPKKKQTILEKLTEKCNSIWSSIKEKWTTSAQKIQTLKDKKAQLDSIIQNQRIRAAFCKTKKQVFRLIHHILPRTCQAKLTVGLGDPYYTGRFLGYAAMLYPACKDSLDLTPDFHQLILEGNLHVKGYVRVSYVLWLALWTILDGNVRYTIKKFKHGGRKKNGKQ